MDDRTAVNRLVRPQREEAALLPPVDVIEDASGITLYADLPGVQREALNLQVDGDTLIIEAQMNLEMPFVEDTAVLTPRGAVATRPGAPSRMGEVSSIIAALHAYFSEIASIIAPAPWMAATSARPRGIS